MLALNSVIFCLAWILGLLTTAYPWGWRLLLILGLGLMGMRWLSLRRHWPGLELWRQGPSLLSWGIAIAIALVASVYLNLRLPYPGSQDIGRVAAQLEGSPAPVTVTGVVQTWPRLTRSHNLQLQVQTLALQPSPSQGSIRGLLYVTLPPQQGVNLHPGQRVDIRGYLYSPPRPTVPHGFDFTAYLARSGIFAGLRGQDVTIRASDGRWGWWVLRQRIVRSQAQYLGKTPGALVSAMVLGHRVVDLPFDLKDRFVQVGLAHALAASGFQVSILLAVLLKVTEAGSPRYSLLVGLSGLLLFGLSSGFEPSVSRAVLMGIAGLGSVASQRQLKPVGLLLLVAIVLLIIQPLWIWDLGFQLSFLATLGLLVTVPPLTQRLDWLPPAIASLLAVPIAAMLWTLPLQLYQFGVAPLYCLLANLCTTPFLIILTIGGFSSAVVALISPWAGSALAWLLSAPTQGLIGLVTFLSQLPGNSLTLGTISVWQLVMLYGLLVSAWLLPFWRKRLPLLMTLTLGVVILPIWQIQTDRFQITLFDRASPPMMVLQQPGATLVLNSGDRNTASQTLIPFLQRQGIDHIDLALATDIRPRWREGWPTLLQRISIGTLAPISISETTSFTDLIRQSQGQPDHIRALQIGERLSQKQISVTVLRHQPTLLQLSIDQQTWLVIIGSTEGLATWLKTTPIAQPQVVWWVAQIEPEVLRQLNPQVLVLTSRTVNPQILTQLQQKIPQVYWTPRDGAIQWRRDRGFERTLSPSENPASPL